MPLVAPNLDDRTFDDLVKEARLRIPRYAPEWTDFNDSDPGMTLVQLFAWLTEMMIFKLNQVPDLNYVKFLQLLGLKPRPAQPAVAYLTFTPEPKADPISLPAGTQVSAQPEGGGDPVVFETEEGLDLVRPPLAELQVYDGNDFQVVSNQNDPVSPSFYPLGWVPQRGNALFIGFDPPPIDKDKTLPRAPAQGNKPTPVFPEVIHFRVFLDPVALAGKPHLCNGLEVLPPPPASIVWEYKPDDTRPWRRLKLFKDNSAAFTREGDILVEGPAEIKPTEQGKRQLDSEKGEPTQRLWLRARLDSKGYPSGKEPVISFLRVNTVAARNVLTVRDESLGFSDGSPSQVFTVQHTPVLAGEDFTVSVEPLTGDPETWERVDDFLASGEDDPHYLLATDTGQVTFGDGSLGRIPPAGDEIIVKQYRYGGGAAGNVPALAIANPVTDLGNVQVTNERPATGGRDEQDVEELKQQAPAFLRCRSRAVTAQDFAALAAQAGGVARAAAIPLAHPDYPGASIPGVVTVVIVPDVNDPSPQPSPEQIAGVCTYLDPFRLVTAEVYVKGPSYRKVTVQAQVTARPHLAADKVRQNVIDAINTELDPLGRTWVDGSLTRTTPGTGGAPTVLEDKQNEDFGRDLHPSRLFGVILRVEGVVAVEQLFVLVDERFVELGQPVIIPPDGLVYGAGHEIRVEPAKER